ncbi:MAG: DMT family transporter [Alphaproteobacteria bacterium]|nr:DMT family transporter [Alphaproteobacteria bacterium]
MIPAPARRNDIVGATYLLLSGAALVVALAMIKHVARELPDTVVVFFRHLVAAACFAPILWRSGRAMLRTDRLAGHALRSACGYGGFLAFVYAVGRMPIADAMALAFTQPLWSAMFARVVFGERLGALRIAAILLGFAGAMLVLKPSGALALPALAALLNALLSSVAMMTVKQLSATEPPERIAMFFMVVAMLLSIPPAALNWATPPVALWPWLIAIGVLAWAGQVCLSRGYALGRFSAMAAMDFTRLPIAVALGWVLFAEAPDLAVLAGMAAIAVASAIIVLMPSAGRAAR